MSRVRDKDRLVQVGLREVGQTLPDGREHGQVRPPHEEIRILFAPVRQLAAVSHHWLRDRAVRACRKEDIKGVSPASLERDRLIRSSLVLDSIS